MTSIKTNRVSPLPLSSEERRNFDQISSRLLEEKHEFFFSKGYEIRPPLIFARGFKKFSRCEGTGLKIKPREPCIIIVAVLRKHRHIVAVFKDRDAFLLLLEAGSFLDLKRIRGQILEKAAQQRAVEKQERELREKIIRRENRDKERAEKKLAKQKTKTH